MAESDPEVVEVLRKYIVGIEDLLYLTEDMLSLLLRKFDPEFIALALRGKSEKLQNFFLTKVSSRMKKDMREVLEGPPKPAHEVQKAVEEVMIYVREKVKTGEIVIDKSGSTKYV
ncbi:MAG: hypothetical protein HOE90_14970 [Bacteriovoracaceae bacterium]|jgi:flagellar motor switch protein FliG|nr:hypothetical protein [Bacteriovoracaceae bacterium]